MPTVYPYIFAEEGGDQPASQLDANFNLDIARVPTLAALRALTSVSTPQVFVAGRTAPLDGFQGVFVYDASDIISADDNGVTIVSVGGKRWKRQFVGPLWAQWYGA